MGHEDRPEQRSSAIALRDIVDELLKMQLEQNNEHFDRILETACASAIRELSHHLIDPTIAPAREPEETSDQPGTHDEGDSSQRNNEPPLFLDDIKDFVVLEVHPRRTGEKAQVLWRILRSRLRYWL